MKQFYSSLIINSKNFPGVHQVFKPRFNKEFFKRVTANIAKLESQINDRYKCKDPLLDSKHLGDLKANAKRLITLKDKLEKKRIDEVDYENVLSQLVDIEDRVMPTVVRLPNRSSKLVPPDDVIVDEFITDFMTKQKLTKVLSHRKLSYINNCYVKSVVGPNTHYYFGIGAKLQDALSKYFTVNLEREKFIPVSGAFLTKSSVVEAVNAVDQKPYDRDPARILTEDQKYVTTHLSESSREALVAFLTTIGPVASNNPKRFMTQGAAYKQGSYWFDGDDKRITQYETLNTLTLNSSIEQYSMEEYSKQKDIIWSNYKSLGLPSRLVHCSLASMHPNEYDSHRIDVWLPSRQEWLQAGRISHYLDHITVRVGMKRGHLIDASVFDGQVLFASIVENRQTSMGKFLIPDVLLDHSTHLTNAERTNYYGSRSANQGEARVMLNHEPRRFLVKRRDPFGHSRKAQEIVKRQTFYRDYRLFFAFLIILYLMIDWTEFWYTSMPDGLRAFCYDRIYRPFRRVWWYLVWQEGKSPPDVPYKDIDRTEFDRSTRERMSEALFGWRHQEPTLPLNEQDIETKPESSND